MNFYSFLLNVYNIHWSLPDLDIKKKHSLLHNKMYNINKYFEKIS